MNEQQIKDIDALASAIVDTLNEVNKAPAIKTSQAHFREVAVVDLDALRERARNILAVTRPEMRSGLEVMLSGSIRQPTGRVESLDVCGPKNIQVETSASPTGNNVLYVHADGVTILRVSRFESLQIRAPKSVVSE